MHYPGIDDILRRFLHDHPDDLFTPGHGGIVAVPGPHVQAHVRTADFPAPRDPEWTSKTTDFDPLLNILAAVMWRDPRLWPYCGPNFGCFYYVGSGQLNRDAASALLLAKETVDPVVIPCPPFKASEVHLYAVHADRSLTVLAREPGRPGYTRDEVHAPGKVPQPCHVAETLDRVASMLAVAPHCAPAPRSERSRP